MYKEPIQTGAGGKLKSVGVNIFSEDYCKTHTGQDHKNEIIYKTKIFEVNFYFFIFCIL